MPDIVVTLLVIVGFLTFALCLRALAARADQGPVRAARPRLDAQRAMMSE